MHMFENGISGSCTHTIFELVAHEESKAVYHGRLTTAPRVVGFVHMSATMEMYSMIIRLY